MDARERRQRYLRRLSALKSERGSWDAYWRELAEYVQPRRSRFFAGDRHGQKRHQSIINGTAGWGLRVLSSGMMAGITSPARPWFRLTTPEPGLADAPGVKAWLHAVEETIRDTLAKSNVYNVLAGLYVDLGLFGVGPMLLEEDETDTIRAYPVPVGEYCLAASARGQVDTLYREVSLTVGQVVERFGEGSCSPRVVDAYRRGSLDELVEVVHVVEPRRDRDIERKDGRNKPFASVWFERAGDSDAGFLAESGFDESPLIAPRWTVVGLETYGASPGMDALGDVKALQLYERRKAQAVERIVDPPMVGPSSLNGQRASLLPGSITYVDTVSGSQRFEPAVAIPPAVVQVVTESIREHESRVKTAFYADLWLMLAQSDSPQMTAREVAERHEEKMLQLGPVMERLEDELLDPLVSRTFGILLRAGKLPHPPEELSGQELRVEYVSIMAQAQKLIATSGLERLAGFAGQLAQAKPDVLDSVDADKLLSVYADSLGVDPTVMVPPEQVAAIREQRAQQAQQQAAMEQAGALAQGAKTLSETDLGRDSALAQMLGGAAGIGGTG